MPDDLMEIIDESGEVNSDLISKVRLELFWSLSDLGDDGATARKLKSALNLNDGAIYSNLKKLEILGYLKCELVLFEGKELELWSMTLEGLEEWKKVKKWLCRLLECSGDSCGGY